MTPLKKADKRSLLHITLKIEKMKMFKAFENDTESHSIHDLTLENQLDCVNLYGNLQITKDQAGLKAAKLLQSYLNDIVANLEKQADLPEQITRQSEGEIENPFL
jgi:hypothetical protein